MPALNSLIWQQCHQILILVGSVCHMLFACHSCSCYLTTTINAPPCHHVAITINNDDEKSLTTQHSTTNHHYGPLPTATTTTRAQDMLNDVSWAIIGMSFYISLHRFLGAMPVRPPTTWQGLDKLTIWGSWSTATCPPLINHNNQQQVIVDRYRMSWQV